MCFCGGFDLAAVLAQLRRDAVELQLAVDFVLGRAGDALVVVQAKQPVLAERVAHLQRALAQRDVVVLGAGEVLHGRAVGLRRQGAHVHLHAAAQLEADLVVALGQHFDDAGKAQDFFDQLRALLVVHAARSGDQHVEIADRLASAAQRTGGRDLLDALDVLQMLGQLLRGAVGFVEQEAPGDAAIIFNRLQDFLLALFAQARQLAQLAFARQLLHAGEIAHLEGAPQQRDGLRAESLDLQQLQHRGPVLLQQLLVRPELAAAAQLLDVGRHALADAGNLQQLLGFVDQCRDLLRQSFDGLGGAAIGADAERVVAVDLHEIGGFVKDVGDGLVVHAEYPSEIVTWRNGYALRVRPLSRSGLSHTHAAAFRRNPWSCRKRRSHVFHRSAWRAVAVRSCRG